MAVVKTHPNINLKGAIRPSLTAYFLSSSRLQKPSLCKHDCRCSSTVRQLRNGAFAISRVVFPSYSMLTYLLLTFREHTEGNSISPFVKEAHKTSTSSHLVLPTRGDTLTENALLRLAHAKIGGCSLGLDKSTALGQNIWC